MSDARAGVQLQPGLRAASPPLPRHQPDPRSVHARLRPALAVRPRRARAEGRSSLASHPAAVQSPLVSWSGRGEAPQLTGSGVRRRRWRRCRPTGLVSGFYLNELLLKLFARHDSHPDVFALYDAHARLAQDRPPTACGRCDCSRSGCSTRSATAWRWSAMRRGRPLDARYALSLSARHRAPCASRRRRRRRHLSGRTLLALAPRISAIRLAAPKRARCCVPRSTAAWRQGAATAQSLKTSQACAPAIAPALRMLGRL